MEQVRRKATRAVPIGSLVIGGDNPIAVQSMACTDTADREATLAQCRALLEAGCEILRLAVPDRRVLPALPELRRELAGTPLVADIHYRPELAVAALEAGFDKVRINPGNLGGGEAGLRRVVDAAQAAGASMRVGVNSGSVERELLAEHGGPTPVAMVTSAERWVRTLEGMGFERLVLSIKSTDLLANLRACRLLADRLDYPQHIGVTEAGAAGYGVLKSAAGLGALLLDGIGDTLRVSLSGDPLPEVKAAFDLLKATGRRLMAPEVIACPTCGRIQVDLAPLVPRVEALAARYRLPIRIALMGCAVNGPGEAREADLAVAGGQGEGLIYRRGTLVGKVPEDEILPALERELDALAREAEGVDEEAR